MSTMTREISQILLRA